MDVVPRYEYRVWARDLGELRARLEGACDPTGTRTSRETYIISAMPDINVKIRDEALDVKQLIGTERDFQLWTPILKQTLPVSAAIIDEVVRLLGADPLPRTEAPREAREFTRLVADHPDLAVVGVAKRRHGYTVDGCILEFAEVTMDGVRVDSVAVEADDLTAATAVADRLGISAYPNESYPAAIRRTLGS